MTRTQPMTVRQGYARLARLLAIALLAGSSTPVFSRAGEVINAGHAGDNTTDLLARLDRDVGAHSPDVVLLLVGTNDLLNSRHAVPLDDYRENLRTLIKRIQCGDAQVLLLTLPPVYPPYLFMRHPAGFFGADGPMGRITAGNAVIHEVARENRVPVVDVFTALSAAGGASTRSTSPLRNEANGGSTDGVHPTAAGYRVIADAVIAVLARENLGASRRIVCFGDSITFGVHVKGAGTATGETYPAFLAEALRDNRQRSGSPRR